MPLKPNKYGVPYYSVPRYCVHCKGKFSEGEHGVYKAKTASGNIRMYHQCESFYNRWVELMTHRHLSETPLELFQDYEPVQTEETPWMGWDILRRYLRTFFVGSK